jgi:hypothetical protein
LLFYILHDAITTNTTSIAAEQLVVLQQFIQPQDDHIVRVQTIGGKVIYAMKVFTKSAFNPCPYLQMSNKRVDEEKLKNFTSVDDPYNAKFSSYYGTIGRGRVIRQDRLNVHLNANLYIKQPWPGA